MASPLLRLPVELRLKIYDCLLDPDRAEHDSPQRTRQELIWGSFDTDCWYFQNGEAHEVEMEACPCYSGKVKIPFGGAAKIHPSILRVSQLVYREALPRLYENRTFQAVNFRTFGTLHEAIMERWWLMNQFASALSESARQCIKSIQLPIMPSHYRTFGCQEAFEVISRTLLSIRTVELEILPARLRPFGISGPRTKNWLYPAMAFEHCNFLLAAKGGYADTSFGRKTDVVEASARAQLDELLHQRSTRRARKEKQEPDYDCTSLHLA